MRSIFGTIAIAAVRSRTRSPRVQMVLRAGLATVVVGAAALAIRARLAEIEPAEIAALFLRIQLDQWALAASATLISFWAVGRYDRVVQAMMGLPTAPCAAGGAGMAAVAIGQTVGLGILTGAFVRWRLLPGLTLWQATRIATLVALSFLGGLAVVAAAAVALSGYAPVPGLHAIALAVLGCAALMPLLTIWPPGLLARIPWPPLGAMGRILALTAIDCLGAAIALAALVPEGSLPDGPAFLTAAILALGLGIVSGTPGGVGPFELAILALNPGVPDGALVAAILGFRLVYYLAPAVIAGLWALSFAPRITRPRPVLRPIEGAARPRDDAETDQRLRGARRAEAALMRDTGLTLMADGQASMALARAGNHLVAIGDPVRWLPGLPRRMVQAAQGRLLTPLCYKVGARTAVQLRRAGWAVQEVAADAWIDPRAFNESSPACRTLRRKLRKAEAAGVTASPVRGAPPLGRMVRINADWVEKHGAERGFSMGRFPGSSAIHGRSFLAYQGDRLLAFVTFHNAEAEWTLDLMRHVEDPPDGTMPALIRAAIAAAAEEGVPRLSLAAAPRIARHLPPRLAARFDRAAGTEGLTRFKAQFDPRWEPLYAAAPGRLRLALGLIAVARAVTRPG